MEGYSAQARTPAAPIKVEPTISRNEPGRPGCRHRRMDLAPAPLPRRVLPGIPTASSVNTPCQARNGQRISSQRLQP